MSKKINITEIEQLLYKPLLFKTADGSESLVMFFGYENNYSQFINFKGKKAIQNSIYINCWYVSKTIAHGEPIIENVYLDNVKTLKEFIAEITLDKVREEMSLAMEIIRGEVLWLNNRAIQLNKLTCASTILDKIPDNQNEKEEGSLFIHGSSVESRLAHIVFSSITNKELELKQEEIEKVGGVVRDIIFEHSSDAIPENNDLEMGEYKRKLNAELEYKILESMPLIIKSNDIKINTDEVIKEIKLIQNSGDSLENS